MDSANRRPLLQQSSDDEEEAANRRLRSPADHDHFQSSSVLTLPADGPNEEEDLEADDSSDGQLAISVNLAKELLRRENAPRDRYGFTYVVFYLLGMTTLLPWNFFITADDYWMYKFRDVTNSTTPGTLTPIQAGFTSDLSVASAIPSTLFLILNAFIGHRISLGLRMTGSMLLVLAFFILTTVMVQVNTDAWQADFFTLTLGSVVIMNMAAAILSGGLFGISGQFPSEYVTAVVSGQALGGIFAALTEIVSLTFGASATVSAFAYFMIGNAVLVLSLVSYAMASRTGFFRYYTVERLALVKAATATTPSSSTSTETSIAGEAAPQFGDVLRKIWLYGFAEWFVFVVTLCVYPAVTVLVTSQNHGNGHPWNDVYFLPVVNYLVFNSGDYLGRILAGMIEWPRNKPLLVAVLAVLRIVFVPALLVCNANPRHNFPTLIHADYIFIMLMAVFSFTNGYLANIALIWAPKSVPSRDREMASSMMAAFLGIGLAFGSSISLIMVQIV